MFFFGASLNTRSYPLSLFLLLFFRIELLQLAPVDVLRVSLPFFRPPPFHRYPGVITC